VCFALQILSLDRAASGLPPVSLAVLQTAAVAVVASAFTPLEGAPRAAPAFVWWAVAGMALVASALAFVAQSWAQRFTPPSHVGLVFAFEPVSAAVASVWWLGERILFAQWIGAAFILAGIVLAETGARRAYGGEHGRHNPAPAGPC
jgi:drug/metabolite transporter (DMT)-like permease